MAFANIDSMASNATFQKRVKVGLVKAAIAISNDGVSLQPKLNLCRQVLDATDTYTSKFALAIATQNETEADTDPTGAGLADGDLYDSIAAVFDSFVR